ncbi:MAG TPA: diacylglycerol kinase family protein [Candidatus Paceibacterota bacterium]
MNQTTNYSEEKRFSVIKRFQSLTHASRGLWVLVRTQHNFWVHIAVSIVVIILGCYFKVNTAEWAILIFSMGFVMASEAFNSAIEIDIDLTSPDFHPYARDTKDVAAGAVLIAFITSAVIYAIVFIPRLITMAKEYGLLN